MTLSLRRGTPDDAAALGDICYRAFKAIAEEHNFLPDLPNPERGPPLIASLIAHPGFYDIVATRHGRPVGSNFLDERGLIAAIGPLTVDPAAQDDGTGRALMEAALDRVAERGFPGVRLVQAGYHRRSLALYLKLGFDAREHLSCLQGPPIGKPVPGCAVREVTMSDLPACNALCHRIHGHDRAGELAEAIAQGMALLVERAGRITAYATPIAFFGHAVAETDDDLKALIGTASAFPGLGFLVPTRNGALMRWCLGEGLRVAQTLTLMSIGLYNEPQGAWLPSIMY